MRVSTQVVRRPAWRQPERVLREHVIYGTGAAALLALAVYGVIRRQVSERISKRRSVHVLTVTGLFYLLQRVLVANDDLLRRASGLMRSIQSIPRAILGQ
ncbi:MAG: hypothetical protein KDK78_02175, partial [Chlamydiia bacterium]|nr:hypothetical protein [Chlamydiia bacterium]